MKDSTEGSRYRDLLPMAPVWFWAAASLTSKLPSAMAPLAMVFLSRGLSGGYSRGALLAAAFVVGEVIGALLLGRYRWSSTHWATGIGLIVGAAGFAGLSFFPRASVAVAALFAAIAGAGPAVVPGALRAWLTEVVPERAVTRALSLDTTLTQTVWAVAPAIVTAMALQLQADAPILLGATLAGLAGIMLLANRSFNAGSMRTFNNPSATRTRNAAKNDSRDITQDAVLRDAISPDSNLDGKEASHTRATRLRDGWPAYATSAAAMIMLASLEIVLTALLQSERLDVSWSGWLLMVFGVTSAIGGIIYGMTRLHWPVLYQSYAFLALTGIMILVTTFAANIPVMVAAIGTAGAFQSGSLITRNLVLRDTLPAALQASGYSMMYAVQGVGYGVAAGICAIALDIGTPQWAVVACLMLAMTLTLICMVCELRMKR